MLLMTERVFDVQIKRTASTSIPDSYFYQNNTTSFINSLKKLLLHA